MSPHRSLRSRAVQPNSQNMDSNIRKRSTRLTRASISASSVTISRYPSSPSLSDEPQRSIYLIIKMPSSKLREVTGGSRGSTKRNVFTEDPIVTGPRTSRPRKRLVEVDTSDEDDLSDQEEDEVDDDDAPGEEDEDADGDLDMDDAPPQPPPRRHAKAAPTSAPSKKAVKGVEAKEMETKNGDYDEDEDLSDLDSDAEGEPDEDVCATGHANGAELEEDELDDEEGFDSDDAGTDPAKMTKRQRGNLGNDFLQLPMGECSLSCTFLSFSLEALINRDTEPQVKKHLTAEERVMRRAEMARRRKNLSEKRNEEEKVRVKCYTFSSKLLT